MSGPACDQESVPPTGPVSRSRQGTSDAPARVLTRRETVARDWVTLAPPRTLAQPVAPGAQTCVWK